MQHDIDFINNTPATVDYTVQADKMWDEGIDDFADVLTEQFVNEYALQRVDATNIGGLIVYTQLDTVVAVYDYEMHVGWVV